MSRFVNWSIALLSLLVIPLMMLAIYLFARRIREQSTTVAERESNVLTVAQEGLSSIKMVQAFGREHVVHAVVGPGRLAKALVVDAARLLGFRAAPTEFEIGRGRQQRRRRNANDGTGSR